MKKYILSFLLMAISIFSNAQMPSVKPEDAKFADELKAKFKDSKIAAVKSSNEFTFDLNTSKSLKSPVTILEKANDVLVGLRDNHTYSNVIFYDTQSEVLKLNAKGLRGRPIYVGVTHKDYEDDGIFLSDAKMCIYSLPFDTRGEKVDFEYQKRYYDYKYLTSVYFHESYPILEKKISFIVPDWLKIQLKEINFEGFDIEKSVVPDAKKKHTTYTYTVKNLQENRTEPSAPNSSKCLPHLLVICNSYTDKDGNSNKLFESVSDLYNWYYSLVEKIGNDDATIKPVVAKLTEGKKTPIEKIESIFYWVQENIRYIAFENGICGFKPESAQNVFKNKYGDCKGMANLTKQMLKVAGFDARLTWIGTTDIPYDYSIPSLAVDNHMICTLMLDGKKYYLDATEDYIGFNDYAHRIQGRPVLIEDKDKYILDKVPEFTQERNKVLSSMQLTLEGQSLKGHSKTIYNGEEKTQILRNYASIRSDNKEESMKRYFSSGDKNLKLSNIVTSNLDERKKPLEVNYDIEMNNFVTEVGNDVYITIDKDKEFGKLIFDSTRVKDFTLYHKMLIVSSTELKIPAGYKVDYLPETVNKADPDFSFNLSLTANGDKIIYNKRITIDNALIKKKSFNTWNAFIKEVSKFYNDQIVLVKK